MIDSHCHLDPQYFEADRAEVLARARAAGVEAFVCVGVGRGLEAPRDAVALAAAEPDVYATVGVHPHDVAAMAEADWQALEALARAPRVVGIGETGLDYYYDHSPREQQRAAYGRFILMARRANLAVVSHVRDAHAEAAEILGGEDAGPGVIHCFSGGVAEARAYLDLGQHLSFSGILTFKNAGNLREAAAFAPLDRILIETDAPYLAPIPHRGRKNEPAYIAETLAALAAVRGQPAAEVDAATSANTRRLFGLPLPSGSADTRLRS
ncbi:MAG TPA: TatD family hydrolase [Polyangia bacterium]|jgi:TatD DNase family protein|nr:TatD family hydrolase [Polyangia bacterium]